MRRIPVIVLACALLPAFVGPASAQQVFYRTFQQEPGQTPDQARQAVEKALDAARQHINVEFRAATSGMLGSVVTGAPYSAVTTNEDVQTLSDGNRIVHKSTYNVSRDGQGRVRREELNDSGAVVSVMIMDPVAGASYVLDPTTRTARKTSLLMDTKVIVSRIQTTPGGATVGEGAITLAVKPAEPLPHTFELQTKTTGGAGVYSFGDATFVMATSANMEYRNESLGTQVVEGVPAEGTRTVGTIPVGQIGNERPIEVTSEQWYSKELQMTLTSRRLDPRTGETTYRVSNLRRGEPDPLLFQVPADYTLKTDPENVLRVIK